MGRLSIIIPMYNVEVYVERCIRSLEDQNIPQDEFEIICINDGSPDNCRGVVEKLQEEYSNIILINQENQGVSRARNAGIDIAVGKYLLFIDPDDYIIPNIFEKSLGFADCNNAQVAFLGYTVLNEDGTIRTLFFNENLKNQVLTGPDAYFYSRGDGRTDPDRMWAVLFNRDLINKYNLRYLSDVPFLEDGEFIARILCLTERCVFFGRSFYLRTIRPGSATNSRLISSEKATNGFFLAVLNLKRFQREQNLTSEQYNFMNQSICKFSILIIDPARDFFVFMKVKKLKNMLAEKGLAKLDLTGVDKEFTKFGSLYNKSVWCFLFYRYLSLILKSIKLSFIRMRTHKKR